MAQHTLIVSRSCQLRCLFCPAFASSPPNPASESLVDGYIEQLNNKTFFDNHPRETPFHIIGGEPVLENRLPLLLGMLRSEGTPIHLWTNGVYPTRHLAPYLPVVDNFYVYLFAPDLEPYCETTGSSDIHLVMDTLHFLRESRASITLNIPVTSDNIAWLPDCHELARQLDCSLLLQYSPLDELSKDEIAHIHHFRRYANVQVLKQASLANSPQGIAERCRATPNSRFPSRWTQLYHTLYKWIP